MKRRFTATGSACYTSRPVKHLIAVTLLALATPALAADNGRGPLLTEAQCAKLYNGYWGAEESLDDVRGCLTWRCNLARGQILEVQGKIADLMDEGGCAQYRRVTR